MLPFPSMMLGKAASAPSGYTDWRVEITDNHGDASFIQIQELKFYNAAGVELPATGGTVLKSSETAGSPATNLFDGTSAEWATASGSVTNQYVGYSYPSAQPVAKVGIKTTANVKARNAKNCALKYYDGSTWQTLFTFKLTWPLKSVERVFPEAAPTAGYYRATRTLVVSSVGGTQTQIVEIELRATSGGADQTAVLTTDAGDANGMVIVSGEGAGNEGYRAYDGVLTTSSGWFVASGSNAHNTWVSPAPILLAEATVLGSANTNRSPSSLKFQGSNDEDDAWADLKSSTGLTWSAGETKTFSVP